MSTEVGSLQASLTLDLSNFRAGMSEAANLAAELGGLLQNALNGTGFDSMTREVAELAMQINNLSGEMTSLQALMNTMTSADLFAQMRTHTAALPSEVAAITSALQSVNAAASALVATFTNARASATELSAAMQGFNASSVATGAHSIDFTQALNQLTQMQQIMNELLTQIQQFTTIDLNTGEILGSGDQMPAFYNLYDIVKQIAGELGNCLNLIRECAGATEDWAGRMGEVRGHAERVAASLYGASMSARDIGHGAKGAANETGKFSAQTGKVEKHLQTTKGYAISVKGIIGGIVISQAFYELLNIMEQLVHGAIEFSQNMQDASVAFEYLMKGSGTSAESFLNALKDIALKSPLDTTDLTASARKLMAMGFSAKATVPALSILTDTAAVFSNSAGDMSDMIDHISLAFGQMLASGKVSAQELRQLYNAGLPIYDLLSEGLGISKEMAKNIGHYNIDSATAVYAVLEQLQKRYSGAAEAMAQTMSGSIEVIRESIQQLLAYGWDSIFEDITAKLNRVAKFMLALVKITQAYGPGGLFQAIFPEHMWASLRQLIGGFQMLGLAAKQLGSILITAFGGGLRIIVTIGAQVVPIIATIANTMLYLARMALAASPALRMLLSLIAALVIANFVAKAVMFLGKAIYVLTGAKAAVAALTSLAKTLVVLTGLPMKVVVHLMAIAAALLAIVASSEKARAALASFFGSIGQKVNNFAQSLDIGFDPNLLTPEFNPPDTSDFSDGLKDLTAGMEELEEATDKAGKSAKKNLQSFDEVFTIDPDTGSGAGGAMEDILKEIEGIGNLNYSNLFDWTGDWATDWGNLTASLGNLGAMAGEVFGDMSNLASELWQSLSDALMASPEMTGSLLGAAIGAVLGALVGHPKIGAALGAIAGFIVGDLWATIAEKFNLPVEAASQASIASGIGAALGAIIGGIFGGKLGALVGAAVGAGAAGIAKLFWEKLQQDFGISAEAGGRMLSTSVTLAMQTAWKYMLSSLRTILRPAGREIGEYIGKQFASESIIATVAKALGKSLKSGIKMGLIDLVASISLDFLSTWLIGEVGKAVGKSGEEITRAEEWGSWGNSILGIIGTIVGTIIAPGVGTLVGGLLGQLTGQLGGGALGLWWDDITTWWNGAWDGVCTFFTSTIPEFFSGIGNTIGDAFSSAWDGVKTFFTSTIPGWWDSFLAGITTFFTATIPEVLYNAGFAIGQALGVIASTIIEFFTVTIPNAWNDFIVALQNFFTVTIPTAWNNFTIALGNFFTEIGGAVVKFFTITIPNAWNSFTNALRNFFTATIPNLWNNFIKSLGNCFTRISTAIKNFFTVTIPNLFKQFIGWITNIGRQIIAGLLSGLKNAAHTVIDWAKSFCRGLADGFKSAFNIHSPSRLTAWIGEMLMAGMVKGLDDNAKHAMDAASRAAQQLTEAIQPETADTNLLEGVSVSSDNTLNALTNWSTSFVNTLAATFEIVASLFDSLTDRLNVATTNMAAVPTAIDAKMGSLRAVDNISSTSKPTAPGTVTGTQIIATLSEETIHKLSGNIAERLYEYLAPLFANMSGEDQQRVIAYIGTLIADDAGLKELERKLKVIQISEGRRR